MLAGCQKPHTSSVSTAVWRKHCVILGGGWLWTLHPIVSLPSSHCCFNPLNTRFSSFEIPVCHSDDPVQHLKDLPPAIIILTSVLPALRQSDSSYKLPKVVVGKSTAFLRVTETGYKFVHWHFLPGKVRAGGQKHGWLTRQKAGKRLHGWQHQLLIMQHKKHFCGQVMEGNHIRKSEKKPGSCKKWLFNVLREMIILQKMQSYWLTSRPVFCRFT